MIDRMTKRALSGLFLASSLALLSTGTALAADQKNVGGSLCQTLYAPEVTNGQGLYHTYAGVQNLSSDHLERLVNCPIERDTVTNVNGLADLNVFTTTSGAAVTCLALSATQYGSIKLSVQKSSASSGTSTIAFGATLNQSVNLGYYDLQCTLPYNSFLNSIEYSEP